MRGVVNFFTASKSETGIQALEETIFEYFNALGRGYSDFLESEDSEEKLWSDDDEVILVARHLKPFLNELKIDSINLSNLEDKLRLDLPIGLPKIINLFASLTLFKELNKYSPTEQIEKLKTKEISAEIFGILPGPCLIYLGTLRKFYNTSAQLVVLNNIIIRFPENSNKFGELGNIVLRVAVNDWIVAANNYLSESTSDRQKNVFLRHKKQYIDKVNAVIKIEEADKKLSLVDSYIMLIWKELKNEIGNINCDELDSSFNITHNISLPMFAMQERNG